MTGMFKQAMNDGENVIGKANKEYTPDIKISGVGIANRHCIIKYDPESRIAMVHPNNEDAEKYQIKVNGEAVMAEPVQLKHGDRLLIGTHHYYLFCDPNIDSELTHSWDDAMKEANADQMNMLDQDNGELEKIRQQAEAMRKEQEEKEREMQEKMKEFAEMKKKQEEELERKKAEMLAEHSDVNMREMEEKLAREKEEFERQLEEQKKELQR